MRSMTLQPKAFSRLRCCAGDKAQSMTTRSISSALTRAAIPSTLPLPIKVAGRIALKRTVSAPTTSRSMARARPMASSLRASGLRKPSSRVRFGQTTSARVVKRGRSRSTSLGETERVSGLVFDRLEHGDRACRHDRGDRVLIDQLRVPVAPEQDAEIVKPGHEALQFHPINQKNRHRRLRLSDMIQERILEVLRLLGCHSYFRSLGLFGQRCCRPRASADAQFSNVIPQKIRRANS